MIRPARKNSTTPHSTPTAPELRPEKAELEELISKIKDLISESPDKAATILSDWTKKSERKPSAPRRKTG
jgi:hypothetical protein